MNGHGALESLEGNRFFRSWGSPLLANSSRDTDQRAYRYQLLWELYDGTAFGNFEGWREYKSAYGLYRQIRMVWDHVHELVEFYATHVWSGTLAHDGLKLPDGVTNAIPLADDTDEKLAAAIGQLYQWWNFQELMTVIPRYTAAVGELLVELRDDTEKGKIGIELVWPGFVSDIRLDEVGNIKYYCVEYQYYDKRDSQYHSYRREIDTKFFKTYRDGKPWDYTKNPVPDGVDPEGGPNDVGNVMYLEDEHDGYSIPNPYGFVPAVWFRHHRVMGARGEPAIWSTQAQLDEINSMFSHLMDKAHISLEAPILISGNIAPTSLRDAFTSMYGTIKRGFTDEFTDERGGQEELNILEGPAGTDIKTLEIKISEAGEALDRVIKAIEKKCPEITFYSELRQMTQLTGPGASRLLGDVDRKVRVVSAGYDKRLIPLLQMGIAIAGMRQSEGMDGWSTKNTQQVKFANYDLESFLKGDLDFDIMPRDLVPSTTKDRFEVLQLKKSVLPFIPDEQLAFEGGYDKEEAKKWSEEFEKKQDDKVKQQMEMSQKQPFGAPGAKSIKPEGAPPGGPQKGSSVQRPGNARRT